MSDQVFFCPGCRKAYDGHRRPPTGQLFDCPNCQLLFAPADRDFAGGAAPREYQTEGVEEGIRAAPKSPSARVTRRRLKPQKTHELVVVWISGGAMLGIAAIIIAIVISGRNHPPASQPTDQMPKVVVETATTPPADSTEKPATTPLPTALDEKFLLGEWESIDQPIVGLVRGEGIALTFESNESFSMQSRSGLQKETIKGRWRLSGSMLTLHFGEIGRELPLSVEMIDSDRITLTALGQRPGMFQRKKC